MRVVRGLRRGLDLARSVEELLGALPGRQLDRRGNHQPAGHKEPAAGLHSSGSVRPRKSLQLRCAGGALGRR